MRCDILTLFPQAVEPYLAVGILGKAVASGIVDVRVHDLRRWAINRYGQVDDEIYGGGPGMAILAPVAVAAVEELAGGDRVRVVLPDPRGRIFTQEVAKELAFQERLIFLCGRYEGFDARVAQILQADEVSIGDYVVSGGELPALVILDAVLRQVRGVVGDPQSVVQDSFTLGLLDFPVYTRPRHFRGLAVPDVLLSGNHEAIRRYRLRESLRLTLQRRPELLQRHLPHLPPEVQRLALEMAEELGLHNLLAGDQG
ncbi:MAG: tRNA (guanosine(37)-N1)-methyltransferase TrmD [Thermoanaerobaculum sp.]|nr:tRNA (guanosine(37)-N1)-methyltransferase TrmD [Thermoanaerobaculum sp.]